MKILYINSCVRNDSRTNMLAKYLLSKLDSEIEEVILNDIELKPLTSEILAKRDELINKNDFSNPMFDLAQQFKSADVIVISAPYWDLSFPALLKIYFENINVVGITFSYNEKGLPVSFCKAKTLFYISTSGGLSLDENYGYGYVKALSSTFYGINTFYHIQAKGLDVYNADIELILNNAKKKIDEIFI